MTSSPKSKVNSIFAELQQEIQKAFSTSKNENKQGGNKDERSKSN
jgi:hypothetical protein